MARARFRPPGSARAIAAFNCGARMAEWGDPTVVDLVNRGESITDLMTPGELQAFRLSTDRLWWRWWHQGYRNGARERGQ